MLFNSITFLVFFTAVYFLYLILRHRDQNRMLLAASFVFYGAWDWRFLLLLVFSICWDFWLAQKIEDTQKPEAKKKYLIMSIAASLGILGFFKYFNFFTDNFHLLFKQAGIDLPMPMLKILLPVGISFYTFQTMSYVIDVYRGVTRAARNFVDFALFVSFFPQLVAGPIERSSHLLPEIQNPRRITLDGLREGTKLIFWGLFKKVAIADTLAGIVDAVFSAQEPAGFAVLLAAYAFAAQIYCDFSGYSDMARGLAKYMGFELMLNFNKPYAATNPAEFWQRWHISLSTWLRDYLYIPLGGNRGGEAKTYRNLLLTMLLGGLWHGAAWTFVVWGVYHGLLLVLHRMFQPFWERVSAPVPRLLRAAFFFHLVVVGWIFFRAESLGQAGRFLVKIFTDFRLGELAGLVFYSPASLAAAALLAGLGLVYAANDSRETQPWGAAKIPAPLRYALYAGLAAVYLLIAPTHAQQFIYFQF